MAEPTIVPAKNVPRFHYNSNNNNNNKINCLVIVINSNNITQSLHWDALLSELSSNNFCFQVRLEKKIPVHLYTRNGDGHFCAIPLSSEPKTSNGSPREVLEGADNDGKQVTFSDF